MFVASTVLIICVLKANSETEILSNSYGSPRYQEFLHGLGSCLSLRDCNPEMTYTGGLDLHGQDGQFAYAWHDNFMQGYLFILDGSVG